MQPKTYFILIICAIFLFSLESFSFGREIGQEIEKTIPEKEMYVSNEILIKFKSGIAEKVKERIYKTLGVIDERIGYGNHYQVITIKQGKVKEALKECLKFKQIQYAEPNHIYRIKMRPDDEFYSYQWHFPLINIEEAWDISTGEGVKVAVIDTGVNPDGKDGFGTRLIHGRDFVKIGNRSMDDNGHGTGVAGTIAQETNNGVGLSGVAPGATILAIKALDESGLSSTDVLADSIRWAITRNVQVINMSFAGPFSKILQTAVNEALEQGVVLVAATGNSGLGKVSFPAAYEAVISVGAVKLDKERASYSNHGPNLDIVAPGGNLRNDQNNDNNADGVLQETLRLVILESSDTNPEWNYAFHSGTSLAAPHVTGVIALLLSQNPGLTPLEVREILFNTAEDLGEHGRDDEYGWGLIDAAAALRFKD